MNQRKGKTRLRGASLLEYVVLLALIGLVAVVGLSRLGGSVRDLFGLAGSSMRTVIASAQLDEDNVASQAPEEDEFAPLIATFDGPASFGLWVAYGESLEDARIDWGPNGSDCDETVAFGGATYTCGFSGSNTVKVYAPAYILTNMNENVVSIADWGDMPLVHLASAFQTATKLESLPTEIPDTVKTLTNLFARPHTGSVFNNGDVSFTGPAVSVPPQVASWNVSGVENFTNAFLGSTNIPDLSQWSVGSGTIFGGMFAYTAFNHDISSWRPALAQNLQAMFRNNAAFNQPIGEWVMPRAINTGYMFMNASAFNQPIGGWDMRQVQEARSMFEGATNFNQDLSQWETSSLSNVLLMFQNASAFAQDVSSWDSTKFSEMSQMFYNTPLLKGDYSVWRPVLQSRSAGRGLFENSGARGDLRCWDVRSISSSPGRFNVNGNIDFEPLWGQSPPESCSTQGVPPSQVPAP